MNRRYEKKGHLDRAGLRELLARAGREHLLPLVNAFALAEGALDGSHHRRDRARGDRGGAGYRRRRCRGREAARGRSGRAGARRTTGGSGAGCSWRTGPPGSRGPGCAPLMANSRSRRTRRSGDRRDDASIAYGAIYTELTIKYIQMACCGHSAHRGHAVLRANIRTLAFPRLGENAARRTSFVPPRIAICIHNICQTVCIAFSGASV